MSLKIRRGTNAERLTITPVEGELIYTTDTKNLYIGDGITAGGKFITGVGYTGSASTSIGYTGSATRIPTGGTTGQVLSKVSNTDYDVSWNTISDGFGGNGYTGSAGVGYTGSRGDTGYVGSSGSAITNGEIYSENGIELYSTGQLSTSPLSITLKASPTTGGALATAIGNIGNLEILSSRGSRSSPLVVQTGDILGAISFGHQHPSSNSKFISLIAAQVDPNGSVDSTHVPMKLLFTANSGAYGSSSKFLTYDSRGFLAINQENAQATCDINGVMRLTPQTAAPENPVAGVFAVADRANWDPASKGSGSPYPVFYNGSIWTALY